MGQIKKKKKKKRNRMLIKIILLVSPFILVMSLLLLFMSSIGMYFGKGSLSDRLTTTENSNLIDRVKIGINNKSKELKDYYNTDRRFILEYQYVLAYTKYLTSDEESSDQNHLKYFEDMVDSTLETLWPNFEYKKEKIITVRKYKVKKEQKDTNNIEAGNNKSNDEEEEKTETKEEDIYVLTKVKSIKASYEITYETKTETKENGDEKITITKPTISGMKQTDKTWDVLRSVIKKSNAEEDINNAVEVILASAAAYINENVTEKMMENMIFTGASSGSVNGVKFTGNQAEFIEKVSIGAAEAYKKYNVLPSITIAQAILESGWGKSGLTAVSNNLFGIKAYGWNGASVDMLTREVAADGSEYYISATRCNMKSIA